MDQDDTTMSTPRSSARRAERDARTIDSPERRRIPGPQLPPPPQPFQLPTPAPLAGPTQSNDPFQNNYAPAPRYQHLPANLAQAVAQLPPLQPVRRRGRGRAAPSQQNIPLPQAVAQLPAYPPVNRARDPRHPNQPNNWAPLQYAPVGISVFYVIYQY